MGTSKPAGSTTCNADGAVRIATLVDVIESATVLARLKPSVIRGCRSPFEVRHASGGAGGDEEHLAQALDALPALARAVAAFHALTARPATNSDVRARRSARENAWSARVAADKLRLRWERWLAMAHEALVVPDGAHLAPREQGFAPTSMTPAELELARETGCLHAFDPFALADEDRARAESLVEAHRAHVAARIAATFRAGQLADLRGLSRREGLDPWVRFAELADAIAATERRTFGLAVACFADARANLLPRTQASPPACVFGALRICEPSDPACAMSFELPDRPTTERLRDHLGRLRAFAPRGGGSIRPTGRDSWESWRTLALVHRLGRECRHVEWNSCALGWSTSGRVVWAGRPGRDEGLDIAESLQRSGFRSIWFDADMLGASD